MRRRRKPRKSRKRLVYGVIAFIFILICVGTYFCLNPSNQTPTNENPPDQTLPHEAAIVDHLSFREETQNETFKNSSISMLETAGFNVTYYPGENVTVDFYKNLVSHNYGLILLRVHSAIIYGLGDNKSLGLFTSELEDESKSNTTYYDDVSANRIVRAYFPDDPTTHYFAIAPGFVEKYGNFQNTIIIMMGCDGLKYNPMAEAFIKRGAKVCIGWNGLVSTPHTDNATTRLLQYLVQRNTIREAVNETMKEVGPEKSYVSSQGYESELEYYPKNDDVGNYIIQFSLSISGMETLRTNTVLAKEEKKGTRLNWL